MTGDCRQFPPWRVIEFVRESAPAQIGFVGPKIPGRAWIQDVQVTTPSRSSALGLVQQYIIEHDGKQITGGFPTDRGFLRLEFEAYLSNFQFRVNKNPTPLDPVPFTDCTIIVRYK